MIIPDASIVLAYVSKYPGSSAAKIAASIDAPTVLVSRVLKQLHAERLARKRGKTKATKWYATAK